MKIKSYDEEQNRRALLNACLKNIIGNCESYLLLSRPSDSEKVTVTIRTILEWFDKMGMYEMKKETDCEIIDFNKMKSLLHHIRNSTLF